MVDETSVAERLAAIETRLENMDENWEKHTDQDAKHYSEILGKVNQLLIDKAVREGEATGIKRMAGAVSAFVTTALMGIGLLLKYLLGN